MLGKESTVPCEAMLLLWERTVEGGLVSGDLNPPSKAEIGGVHHGEWGKASLLEADPNWALCLPATEKDPY